MQPPDLDPIFEAAFHGFPKDRIVLAEDAASVREVLRLALDQRRIRVPEYCLAWCTLRREQHHQHQQQPSRWDPPTAAASSFCDYFACTRDEYQLLNRDDMRQISLFGLQNDLKTHVSWMEVWTQTTTTQDQKEKRSSDEQEDSSQSPTTTTTTAVPVVASSGTTSTTSTTSTTPLTTPPLLHRKQKRTVQQKIRFDPGVPTTWSESRSVTTPFQRPRHALLKNRRVVVSKKKHPLFGIDRTKRGTKLGWYPPKSLWKIVRAEDSKSYIVEITTKGGGVVSEQGRIEVLWKGYGGSKARVYATDLILPSDADFDAFQSDLEHVRKKV
jgi:hypothetical protein